VQHTVKATNGKVITQKNTILNKCEEDLCSRTEKYDWQTSNLIFASFFGICIIGGLLMRPLGTNRPLLWPTTEPELLNVSGVQESIPPASVAWRAGRTNRVILQASQATYCRLAISIFLIGFLGSCSGCNTFFTPLQHF
jgi:hypothetical protein